MAQVRHVPLACCVSLVPSLSGLAFLMPILVLFWCATGVGWLLSDSDTGWRIRTGEWILRNWRIPSTDLFSFTRTGQPWFAWEWISDVSMAVAHSHFGLGGVVLLSLLVLGVTSLCVYKNTVEETEHRLIAISLTGLAIAASTIHWLARPHLVTPLFTAVFCSVFNRVEKRATGERFLLLLPADSPIGSSVHGGFFVGIIPLVTYGLGTAAEELVHGKRYRGWVRARKYLLTAATCIVASLVNPYGYRLHVHVAQYLGSSFYFNRFGKFQSPDFHLFTAAYFETLLVLAITAAAWDLGKGKLIQALMILSWAHLARYSVRNIPIFAAVSVPGIGLAMRDWFQFARARWPLHWRGKLAASLDELETGLQVIAGNRNRRQWHRAPGLTMLVLASLLSYFGRMKALHADFDPSAFPTDAAAFFSRNEPVPRFRLYASWAVEWVSDLPSLAFDSSIRRQPNRLLWPSIVEQGLRASEARPDFAEVLTQYQVNAALVPVDSPLATALRESADWKLVYSDRVALMFVTNTNQKSRPHTSARLIWCTSAWRGSYVRNKGRTAC